MAVDLERLAASRAAQGLPPKVTDPAALHRLAVLFSAPAASHTKSDGQGTHPDRRSAEAG